GRLIALPDRTADGDEVGPGLDQWGAIAWRDPADRDARYLEQPRPPLQKLELRAVLARLGLAREEAAERNIVGARFAGFHRQVTAGMARDSNLRLAPERLARLSDVPVLLPEMDPVGLQPLGERDRIVDDERDLARRADGLQRFGKPRR